MRCTYPVSEHVHRTSSAGSGSVVSQVVERPREYRIKSRNKRIKEYFYGLSNELSPHVKVASWKDVQIFKTGGGMTVSTCALGA